VAERAVGAVLEEIRALVDERGGHGLPVSPEIPAKAVVCLLRALADPEVPVWAFLALAAALRAARNETAVAWSRAVIGRLESRPGAGEMDGAVMAVLTEIEAAGPAWAALRLEVVAERVGVPVPDLTRRLAGGLGVSYRQVRQALVLRRAVRRLVDTDEQVAPIAYRLDYDHPSHFDRQFAGFFGLAPKELRRQIRPS